MVSRRRLEELLASLARSVEVLLPEAVLSREDESVVLESTRAPADALCLAAAQGAVGYAVARLPRLLRQALARGRGEDLWPYAKRWAVVTRPVLVARLLPSFLETLRRDGQLHVDGALAFALRPLFESAGEVIAAEHEVAGVYGTFVDLLARFEEAPEPYAGSVHVVLTGGQVCLFDSEENLLPLGRLEALRRRLLSEESSHDEFVVSTLALMLPARLILHAPKGRDQALVLTLAAIFGRRLRLCGGCALCRRTPSQS